MKFNLEKYPFRVYQELEDGENYYIVEFYDYPMCVGTGDTLEAAHQEALIALQNQFDALLEEGYQPTPPNPMFTKEFSGRFTARVSPFIHREITVWAHELDISINQLVTDALAKYIGELSGKNTDKPKKWSFDNTISHLSTWTEANSLKEMSSYFRKSVNLYDQPKYGLDSFQLNQKS